MNVHDSEKMAGILSELGYQKTDLHPKRSANQMQGHLRSNNHGEYQGYSGDYKEDSCPVKFIVFIMGAERDKKTQGLKLVLINNL